MTEYLTKEGLEKFKKELDYLIKTKRKEVSEKLKQAISYGDLRENAAYDSAKEEQGFVEARINALKKIVSQAKIIQSKSTGLVEIGSFVVLKSDNEEEKFQIVGPEEADILNGKISFKSPLGKELLGKKKSDSIKVEAVDSLREYKIINIE